MVDPLDDKPTPNIPRISYERYGEGVRGTTGTEEGSDSHTILPLFRRCTSIQDHPDSKVSSEVTSSMC